MEARLAVLRPAGHRIVNVEILGESEGQFLSIDFVLGRVCVGCRPPSQQFPAEGDAVVVCPQSQRGRPASEKNDLLGTPTGQNENNDANAAGSMHTTASDYAKFVSAVLNATGLKKETIRQMLAPQTRVDESCRICTNQKEIKKLSDQIGWGLGWGLQTTGEGNSFWHWGDNGTIKNFVLAHLPSRSAVVVFTNAAQGMRLAEAVVNAASGSEHLAFDWI